MSEDEFNPREDEEPEQPCRSQRGLWSDPTPAGQEASELRLQLATAARTDTGALSYARIANTAIEKHQSLDDERGQLTQLIASCCTWLVSCLETQIWIQNLRHTASTTSLSNHYTDFWGFVPDRVHAQLQSETRARMIRTLYDLWWYDISIGGVAAAPGAAEALTHFTTPEEREEIEGWLRRKTRPAPAVSRRWYRGAIVDFLLMLSHRRAPEAEEMAWVCGETQLIEDQLCWLLELGRTKKAIPIAKRSLQTPDQITRFADALLGMGHEIQAIKLVQEKLEVAQERDEEKTTAVYVRWLGKRYGERGEVTEALRMQLRQFQEQPDYQGFRSIRETARKGEEDWSSLRAQLVEVFEKSQSWDTLVRIYLGESEIASARACVCRASVQESSEGAGKCKEVKR